MDIDSIPSVFQPIERENWPRAEHFEFFSGYPQPFFSITAEVDCTAVVKNCRERGFSTTFRLWHGVLAAANLIPEFLTRIIDGRPVRYDKVHLSPTILRPDRTFTIGFLPYLPDFSEFSEAATVEVERAKQTSGFKLDNKTRRIDLIHFSTIPWVRFTAVTPARGDGESESEPKVLIGKFAQVGEGRYSLPVSVTVHHGLMDGLHVGEFFQALELNYASV